VARDDGDGDDEGGGGVEPSGAAMRERDGRGGVGRVFVTGDAFRCGAGCGGGGRPQEERREKGCEGRAGVGGVWGWGIRGRLRISFFYSPPAPNLSPCSLPPSFLPPPAATGSMATPYGLVTSPSPALSV
jgi:hypothetical protein